MFFLMYTLPTHRSPTVYMYAIQLAETSSWDQNQINSTAKIMFDDEKKKLIVNFNQNQARIFGCFKE